MDFIIPVLDKLDPSIAQPVVFTMLQNMGQFHGLLMEDPHKHLRNFIEVANTFRNPKISDDVLRLKLFPHSLADKAKEWLNSLPSNSITNWHTLAEKFIMKFFPSNKIVQTRCDITNFMQKDGETLVDVWERFKILLKQCPNHGLPSWAVLQTLYNSLNTQNRALANSTANGMFMSMSFNQAYELLEQMTQNYAQWPEERNQSRRVTGLHEVDPVRTLSAKFDALPTLVKTQGQAIEARLSQPQVPIPQPQVNAVNTEALLREYLVKNETKQNSLEAIVQSIPASLRNLESQLSCLANTLNSRPPGTLPSNTEEPRRNNEQCHMIELRNGRSVNQPEPVPHVVHDSPQGAANSDHLLVLVEPEIQTPINPSLGNISMEKSIPKGQTSKPSSETPVVSNRPPPPFPQRLQKQKQDNQFRKFLDLLKQLHINIPFVDALEQMPTYVKFMKEILFRKRRLEEFETVALTQESSKYLLSKLPPKLEDPGSFTILCTIGDHYIGRALCDLGVSINLMPMSVIKKLKVGEPSPTIVTLQLAEKSLVYPEGKLENILVKVDKFILLADFIILDYEEDREVPIILGRAFLATGGVVIHVKEGELTMNVNGEQIKFNILKSMKYPREMEECSRIDVIDVAV
ncbi:uncharacterized protein LOC133311123 [Gastrolobium bilobum]|uniref:uncharacterized protein LOC133311123 n=1 Tax=Gastrolobium bilobum TaxID=150636 RepID=UPI002AAF5D41|nr:uncharacterized protein LOC133311123 [Gastrolobium bilobum]